MIRTCVSGFRCKRERKAKTLSVQSYIFYGCVCMQTVCHPGPSLATGAFALRARGHPQRHCGFHLRPASPAGQRFQGQQTVPHKLRTELPNCQCCSQLVKVCPQTANCAPQLQTELTNCQRCSQPVRLCPQTANCAHKPQNWVHKLQTVPTNCDICL